MAGQRPGLVDGPVRRDERHEVAPPAVGPDRHPAADDLPEDRQVGLDPVAGLGAAAGHPEAGDHLVEHEEGAVRARHLAEPVEEPRRRGDDADVRGHRLDDDRRDLIRMALEGRADSRPGR